MHECALAACMLRSEDSLQGLVLSFYHVGPQIQLKLLGVVASGFTHKPTLQSIGLAYFKAYLVYIYSLRRVLFSIYCQLVRIQSHLWDKSLGMSVRCLLTWVEVGRPP